MRFRVGDIICSKGCGSTAPSANIWWRVNRLSKKGLHLEMVYDRNGFCRATKIASPYWFRLPRRNEQLELPFLLMER